MKDQESGQKLELNWYPEGSTFDTPYCSGEGLDHIAFRVEDVTEAVKELSAKGIEAVRVSASLAEQPGADPKVYAAQVGYVKDPDGNWVEFYSHTQPLGESIPIAY